MALDEYIFGKFIRFIKNKPADAVLQQRTVELESIQSRLTILARALTGNAIELFPAINEGGYKGNSFFLPASFSFYANADLNLSFYFFRIWYLSVQQKLSVNWYELTSLPDETAIIKSLQHAPFVLEQLFNEFPLLQIVYERLISEPGYERKSIIEKSLLYGKLMQDSNVIEPKKENDLKTGKIKSAKDQRPKTIIKAKPVEEIINLIVDIRQQEDYVMTHNFEKVDTADEFSGSWRDFDGEDELEDHKDALDELNMKYTVRVDDETHSIYEAGYTDNSTIAESKDVDSGDNYIVYDEWDCFKKIYRQAYSKVYPSLQQENEITYYQNTLTQNKSVLAQLRKMLASINNKWQQQRLQVQGKEIDIDMATAGYADVHAGRTPSDKVYISDRNKQKDLSILLLLDTSLSSDSYADGNRIIDVEKQTAILFGEVLNEYNIDFSIHGFHSKTRNYLSYTTLKAFDEKWEQAKYRTGSLHPSGYTRIGPALRHSGALIKGRETKNKWVILLSDGKPNDYDRYEGKYGINDVKQAIKELHKEHINTYALAIEANARYYLPQMFGNDHYQIVSSPVELLKSLIRLYERIRYGG